MEQDHPEEKEVDVGDVRFSEFYLSQNLLDVLRIAGPHLRVFPPWVVELEHLAVLFVQLLHQLVSSSHVSRTYESQPIPNRSSGHLLKRFYLRNAAGQCSGKKTSAERGGCH